MAQRRMFSKLITNSGKFLKMPASCRLLYYDLGMNADDDGVAEWYTTIKMSGATEQDVQVLQANGFVQIFNDDVLIIRDWHENNQLRLDRYTKSRHLAQAEFREVFFNSIKDEAKSLPIYSPMLGKKSGNLLVPQVRLGKVSIGKVIKPAEPSVSAGDITLLIQQFKAVNPTCEAMLNNKTERNAAQQLIAKFGLSQLLPMIDSLGQSNSEQFAPFISTPRQFQSKFGALKAYYNRPKPN